MPPSGFSQKAINGLLAFVEDAYQSTLDRYRARDLTEKTVLRESITYLDGIVQQSVSLALDGTVSERGIKGLQAFMATNYEDLIKEIYSGKKQEGHAMQAEIAHIRQYLAQLKLEEQ